MLIQPTKDELNVREIADPRKFNRVVRARAGQRVRVIIMVAGSHPARRDEPGLWYDALVFWEGPADEYEQHIPTEPVLVAVGLQEGAAFAKPVVRAVI